MESWCRASCWRLTEGICQVPDITQPASVPPGTEPHGRNAASENISIGVVGSQEDAWYAQSGLWTDTNQMAVAPSGGSWLVPGRGVDILGNTVEGGPQKFTSSAVTLPTGAGSGLPLQDTDEFNAGAAQSQSGFDGLPMNATDFNNFLSSLPAAIQVPQQYRFISQPRPQSAMPSMGNRSADTAATWPEVMGRPDGFGYN